MRWHVLLVAAFASGACAADAESVGSGDGSEKYQTDRTLESPISVHPASITAKAFKPLLLKCDESSVVSVMQVECRYFACSGETCLALQMCWRMIPDGPHCAFWDYPDDTMCCPDTAGQVVDAT